MFSQQKLLARFRSSVKPLLMQSIKVHVIATRRRIEDTWAVAETASMCYRIQSARLTYCRPNNLKHALPPGAKECSTAQGLSMTGRSSQAKVGAS